MISEDLPGAQFLFHNVAFIGFVGRSFPRVFFDESLACYSSCYLEQLAEKSPGLQFNPYCRLNSLYLPTLRIYGQPM